MASFLSTLFGGGAEKEAADRDRAIAQQYGDQSQKYLTTGYDTGVTNLNKAVGAYDPLSSLATKYNKAGDLSLDALGVNGPEGNTRATNAFQTTAGYDLTQKAAIEALNRKHAIAGDYASGTADIDTTNWITKNLYEQQYAPWMAGIERAGNQGGAYTGAVAAGQAGGYGSLASLAQQYAGSQAGVAGNVAGGMTKASDLQASGEASGAKNLLGAGLGLLSAGATAFGGGGLTSLAGMMGGGGSGPIVPGGPGGPRPLYA